MKNNIQKLIEVLGEGRVLVSEPLAKYSSFRIGGPADLFYRAKTQEELVNAVNAARKLAVPYFILGGGTNLLISDLGFDGIVIKNDTGNIRLLGIKGKKSGKETGRETSVSKVYLEVESGVSVNRLVRFTLDLGFDGLQFFLGQPGSIGGATYINAHNMKKGQYFGDKIIEAAILTKAGSIERVDKNHFHFGYDNSILQKSGEVLLSAVLELTRGDKVKLWQEAQETLGYRQSSQPTGFFSSGCTFRNIPKSDAMRLATPQFTTSAGYLLDAVGLKGEKIGQAMFSVHHANFIVHKGGATAVSVLELIKLAKKKVKERFNVDLCEEIVLVGEF